MSLQRFTSTPKPIETKILVDNSEIKITKIGEEVEFFIKKPSAIKKYEDFLFLSPTTSLKSNSKEELEVFFQKSLEKGVEGIMVKNLNSSYKPGLRSSSMAKLKEMKEDLDVVILGAEHGGGKRAGFFSSFIVGVKDDKDYLEEDFQGSSLEFVEVGKVASGIKELGNDGASLVNLTRLLLPLKTCEKNNVVWFEPRIILQIRYQEVQKSTTYSSGLALRFPRIIMLREDKPLNEVNSLKDLKRFENID